MDFFLKPDILWNLVWALPASALLAVWASRKRRAVLQILLGPRCVEPGRTSASKFRRVLKDWLFAGGVFFLIIACARPFWGQKLIDFTGKGRDVLVIVDTSKSMLSDDIKPSRLRHAKWLVRELADSTPGDRYGLIAFAGKAFLECPLTVDRASLHQAIEELSTESVPMGGTNIAEALSTAAVAFKAAAGAYRAVVLVTDGEELQGDSAAVISEMKSLKIPVIVIGIGDPDKPGLVRIPGADGKLAYLRDSKGEIVKTRLNEEGLKRISAETDGIYIRSTNSDPGLDALKTKIEQVVPEKYATGKMTRPIEKFQLPLAAAVLLFLAWMTVGERTSNGKTIPKGVLSMIIWLGLLAVPGASAQPGDSAAPSDAVEPPSPPDASVKSQPSTVPPPIPKVERSALELFNEAQAELYGGDSPRAEKLFAEARNKAGNDAELKSKAHQGLGSIAHAKARAEVKPYVSDPKALESDETIKARQVELSTLRGSFEKTVACLAEAEEQYCQSMTAAQDPMEFARNQQILLADRAKHSKTLTDVKAEIKFLADELSNRELARKLKQAARAKAQEAWERQGQANKAKDEQAKKLQDETVKLTAEEVKAIDEFKKAAANTTLKEESKAAEAAAGHAGAAVADQAASQGAKAEENLKKALDALGGPLPPQQKSDQARDDAKQKTKDAQQEQQKSNDKQQAEQKRNEAEKKTQEALDKQKQANQQKEQPKQEQAKQEQSVQDKAKQEQSKQEQSKEDQSKQEQSVQDKAKQEQSKQEQSKEDQSKQDQSVQNKAKQEQSKQEQSVQDKAAQEQTQKEAEKKTQDAQKAAQDFQEAAQKTGDQTQAKDASEAKSDIQEAAEKQQAKDGKAAEKALEEALEKLKAAQRKDESKENAEKKAEEAQKACEKACEKAGEAGDDKAQKAASEAKQDVKEAQQAQEKDDGKKAEEKLAEALAALKKGDKEDDSKKEGEAGAQDEQKKDEEQPKEQPKSMAASQSPQQKEEDITKEQAAALLEVMAKDEKPLRDALKDRLRQMNRERPVDKDW